MSECASCHLELPPDHQGACPSCGSTDRTGRTVPLHGTVSAAAIVGVSQSSPVSRPTSLGSALRWIDNAFWREIDKWPGLAHHLRWVRRRYVDIGGGPTTYKTWMNKTPFVGLAGVLLAIIGAPIQACWPYVSSFCCSLGATLIGLSVYWLFQDSR
jgi:hypothetical protein